MPNQKTKRPPKMLFGAVDIGYRIELYTKFIRQHFADRLKTESLVIFVLARTHYQTSYDYEFHFIGKNFAYRWGIALMNFVKCLFKYDIFYFLSGETLLPRRLRRLEMFTYKLAGKRIVMHFVGSDLRSVDYSRWRTWNMKQYLEGRDDFPKTEPWQNKLIKDTEKFSDYTLVSTPDLLELIPSAHYYPVVLDVEKFLTELHKAGRREKKENEVVILHCPSDREAILKGTTYINEVLEKIKSKGEYKIHILLPAANKNNTAYANRGYAVSRYELFELYNSADIVIDQMITGWYGLQSIEALAAGKEVISYVDKPLKKYLFPDCPIHLADINSLENVLTGCIEKIVRSEKTNAQQNLEWVKKYHTIEANHASLLEAWNISGE